VRLRDFYIANPSFDQPFTRMRIPLRLSEFRQWRTKMDALYVVAVALFTALTFALIAGCEKLMLSRRGQGARS
jgi:hypothetical protein